MEPHLLTTKVKESIRQAAIQAVGKDHHRTPAVERFLRTGEEIWEGAGSGRFTRSQIEEDGIYSKCAKTGLRILFDLLAVLLPPEARTTPQVAPEAVAQRIHPMINGIVQPGWQAVALRELAHRLFVLNIQGAKAGLEAELSTGFLSGAWQVLWICFEDYGLTPAESNLECDGLSAGQYAHVRWSSYVAKDPYSDVVVHEAAHLLHYLKPEHYGLRVRRGQERFVDVEFKHRELFAFACEAYSRMILHGVGRKAQIAFAEEMPEDASSFPQDCRKAVADLVLTAARARNGWRVIRDAVVSRSVRRIASVPRENADAPSMRIPG